MATGSPWPEKARERARPSRATSAGIDPASAGIGVAVGIGLASAGVRGASGGIGLVPAGVGVVSVGIGLGVGIRLGVGVRAFHGGRRFAGAAPSGAADSRRHGTATAGADAVMDRDIDIESGGVR